MASIYTHMLSLAKTVSEGVVQMHIGRAVEGVTTPHRTLVRYSPHALHSRALEQRRPAQARALAVADCLFQRSRCAIES